MEDVGDVHRGGEPVDEDHRGEDEEEREDDDPSLGAPEQDAGRGRLLVALGLGGCRRHRGFRGLGDPGHELATMLSPAARDMTLLSSASSRARVPATLPSRITWMTSERSSSSGRSELMTSTAVPWSASSRTSRWISAFAPTSTPRVGSSSTITRGRRPSHLAMTIFCWFPPL